MNYDEFEEIRLGVYRTACEAMLGIWGHKIFRKSHTVKSMFIHEPGKVEIIYEDGQEEEVAEREMQRLNKGIERKTMLNQYFKLNRDLESEGKQDVANAYTYATINQAYYWNQAKKEWLPRMKKRNIIVRIGSAAPGNVMLQVHSN